MGLFDDYITNRDKPWYNKEWLQATAAEVTIFVTQSGTDTETEKYFNKPSGGGAFILRPTDNVLITSINSGGTERLLGDPITVGINTTFAVTRRIPRFTSMKIKTLNANTNVKLLVM